jgi:predicted PurR-regulated permease PerM
MNGELDVDRSRALWWAMATVLFVLLAWILVNFIGTFVFALFVYYSTRPLYNRLDRRIGSSSVAAATSLVALALPAILLLAYTLTVGVQELSEVVAATDLDAQLELLGPYVDFSAALEEPQALLDGVGGEQLLGFTEDALSYVGLLGTFAMHLLIVTVVAYYLLRDGYRLSRWLRSRIGDERGVMDTFFYELDRDLQIVFFGNILTAIATGVIGALTYSALNLVSPPGLSLPYAVLLGLLTGAASLIPIVGMKLVYVPMTGYLLARLYVDGLAELLWFPVAFFVLSLVVVDSIPDFFLRPYVSGRNVHLGAVMVSYIVGPLLFGWYGLFLAPLLLIVTLHFCRLILPELLAARTIQPYAVDPTYVGSTDTDAASTVGDQRRHGSATEDRDGGREAEKETGGSESADESSADDVDAPHESADGSTRRD